jgi:DNA-nicking Smr family endonuclease
MSDPDRSEPPRRRRLSEDEHRLWSGITRSVTPLKRKPAAPKSQSKPQPKRREAVAAAVMAGAVRGADALHAKPVVKIPSKPAAKSHPPLLALERRQKQRLARGTEPIDQRIDLHGRTQSEAYAALLAFLRRAQHEGARYVLVVTGKGGFAGADAARERGVLKRQVPLWLRQAEFRHYVLAAEDAHRTHGGEGALYIRIKRLRT